MPFMPAPSAVLAGYPAAVLGRYLARAAAEGAFDRLADRDRVLRAISDLERAGAAWRDQPTSAVDGTAATVAAATGAPSEPMDIDQAAAVLHLQPRRVRQIAPALGTKVAGRWVLDAALVAAEARRRAEEAA